MVSIDGPHCPARQGTIDTFLGRVGSGSTHRSSSREQTAGRGEAVRPQIPDCLAGSLSLIDAGSW